MRNVPILFVLAASLTSAPFALGQGIAPNAIVNGDFELYLPSELMPLEGSALDECIGIGHQALYGSDTLQADLTGGDYESPDPTAADPEAGAARLTADPEGEVLFLSGYGNCIWGAETGYDLAWINPVHTAQDDAVQWSAQNMEASDWDDDGDREARIPHGGPGHNMWHSYANAQQAFTGNFAALEFDVEGGAIASSSLVQISFSSTPLEAQTPWLGSFLSCGLNFRGADLLANMDGDGHVSMDPVDASFFSRSSECDAAAAAWATADDEERRSILGRQRIVQVSFWSFDNAPEDPTCGCAILIDNVSLTAPTTVAEEVAAGNVVVAPSLEGVT